MEIYKKGKRENSHIGKQDRLSDSTMVEFGNKLNDVLREWG